MNTTKRISKSDIWTWTSDAWARYMTPKPIFPPANVWGCTTMSQKYGGTFSVSRQSQELRRMRMAASRGD